MAGAFAIIPGILMIGLGGFLGHVYLRTSLCIRREMSNLKGPMVSQVTTSLAALRALFTLQYFLLANGWTLASIRAYGLQGFFRAALNEKVNRYIRASLTLYDVNRWIGFRIELLGALFAGVVSAYFVYGSTMQAGYVGLTLSLLVNFSGMILGWVRLYNDFELKGAVPYIITTFISSNH